MTGPRTKTGREVVASEGTVTRELALRAVLAIEAEAVAAERARIAARVRALHKPDEVRTVNDREYGWVRHRNAVLAIIEAES